MKRYSNTNTFENFLHGNYQAPASIYSSWRKNKYNGIIILSRVYRDSLSIFLEISQNK
mgnify:FL=1